MKPINEIEFEMTEAKVAQKQPGLFRLVKKWLTTNNLSFITRKDPTSLPARLRRDARMDELEIEKKKVASAPLIR